ATLLGEGKDAGKRGFRDDGQVDALLGVLGCAVELIEERNARRAGGLLNGKPRRLTGLGPWPDVAGIAREHEAVDRERVPAGREQLRQPDVGWGAIRSHAAKRVVLANDAAGRQLPPGGGHRLRGTAKLDLLLEQAIPRRPVFS